MHVTKTFEKMFIPIVLPVGFISAALGAIGSFLGSSSGAAAIGAAGSLAAGALGAKGARDANISSAESIERQMAFQERMSNTAYQRAMKDMKKAGLNPILAAKYGPASTPSGNAMTYQNELGAFVTGFGETLNSFSNAQSVANQTVKVPYEIDSILAGTNLNVDKHNADVFRAEAFSLFMSGLKNLQVSNTMSIPALLSSSGANILEKMGVLQQAEELAEIIGATGREMEKILDRMGNAFRDLVIEFGGEVTPEEMKEIDSQIRIIYGGQ